MITRSAALVLLLVQTATSASIRFLPDSATAVAGDLLSVRVVIAGLSTGNPPPSVSAFQLTAVFDSAILRPVDVTFGRFLGSIEESEALAGYTITPGSIDFAVVSLLSPQALDLMQPGRFPLGTLTFQAMGAGATVLRLVPETVPGKPGLFVRDSFGNPLDVEATDANLQVIVPEPATLTLLLAGLAFALLRPNRLCPPPPGENRPSCNDAHS